MGVPTQLRNYIVLVTSLVLLGWGIATPLATPRAQAASSPSPEITALFGSSYLPGERVTRRSFSEALFQLQQKHPSVKPFESASPLYTRWQDAVKNVCVSLGWKRLPNFSLCAYEIKKAGILFDPLPETLLRSPYITYEELATLIERGLIHSGLEEGVLMVPATTTSPTPPPLSLDDTNVPPRALPQLSFQQAPNIPLSTTYFTNITLDEPLSRQFYLDEVYYLKGSIDSGDYEDIFAFVCWNGDSSCSSPTNFSASVTNGRFSIPLTLNQAGNIKIGLIPGRSGESKTATISILPEEPVSSGAGEQPTTLSSSYAEGETRFQWSGGNSGELHRLVFFQGNKRRDYIFQQSINSFTPPSKDFNSFTTGAASWYVQDGPSRSTIKSISLTRQMQYKTSPGELQILSLKEVYPAPTTLTFRGTALVTLSKRAAVTLPNGFVEEFIFSDKNINPGETFEVKYTMKNTGTYIFEINNTGGAAALNVPIYVGSSTPLLPDFFALNTPHLDTAPLGELSSARERLLNLINADRAAHGLNSITVSTELDTVAQAHSENMGSGNFFAHIDPQGRSPDDRRRAAGVTTPIRENLGRSTSIELTQEGLMRSPVHRDAILDPDIKRVGLGIVKDATGYYYITQNFARDPLTPTELAAIQNDLYAEAQAYRKSQNIITISRDQSLETIAATWSGRMIDEEFFGLTDSDGNALAQNVRALGVTSSIQLYALKTSDYKNLIEELVEEAAMNNSTYAHLGIGLGLDELGEIYMTVIYTP
ncbi:hypothetical protein CO046_04725 [Candidatus Peregrinibacteria bacterium CG_4_9_14_0_2_um_filter_53_11]|nr:MAG: hypothetical protein CO046_04725 [Candidatus Peregrinibacteria bacterium CG_4_9_14_0_2_um_filter_53_11]